MTTPNKTTAIATTTTKPSAIALMASRLSVEPAKLYETLKATVFKNATSEELMALIVVANEYGLNPFLKELYCFPAKGGGVVPIISVDGWNKMMIRQPDFDGIEFEFEEDAERHPITCTCTIHVKNRTHPVRVTEYFEECKRNTDPWNNMPHRMLRNRTLCQASRIAFGFSGVKHEEETIDVESVVMPSEPLRAIKAPAPADASPEAEKQPQPAGATPQAELEAFIMSNGFTFADLVKWANESGNIEDAGSLPGFGDVPAAVCARLLKAKTGLLKGLAMAKGGAQ